MDEVELLRIAIVSDLHFIQSEKSSDTSWLSFDQTGEFKDKLWPLLLERIDKENITADILLSPGDITTYANNAGLKKAWQSVLELGEKLDCKLVAAATGNHDVQTRPLEKSTNTIRNLNYSADLTENLKLLSPPYPLVDLIDNCSRKAHDRRIFYFGSDYLIFDDHDDYRLVVFNSCARHTQDPDDYERGKIAESALTWLDEQLNQIHDPKKLKPCILLCHHHPIQHEDERLGAYDFMLNGTRLMDLLLKYGHWLVIHGHKHHATMRYGGGGIKQIPVFSAGTLAAHKKTLGDGFNNQFYIIEIEKNNYQDGLKGTVRAWSWAGNRWATSKSRQDGMIDGVGFGYQGTLLDIIKRIDAVVPKAYKISWDDIVNKIPDLHYVMPRDLELLRSELTSFDIDMNFDHDDCLQSLSRAEKVT